MQDINHFSLTRVRLRHYRSIAEADVDLGRLLLLVGPNGSGKSNFLDALRLLSDALQTSLDQALRTRGGVAEVRRRSTGHPTHFSIDLEFRGPGFEGAYGFEVAAVRGGGFRVSRENCAVRTDAEGSEGERRADAHFRIDKGALTDASEPVMPPVSGQRLYLVSAAGLDAFRPVFDGLAGISVFSLNPDVMRQPQTPDTGEFLHRDGANIASVLHRLEPADKRRIEEYLQQIVPGMHEVSRTELGNWETLEFAQDVPGAKNPWRFPAQSVSDGTLRALGVLVALFAGTGPTLSTVGIEEPESALHPAAAGVLLDALRDASERRQVIVTSHSPDLLDRHDFELSQLRAVRSIAGETRIGPLDEAGSLAMREQLYTPGELLRTDQLLPEAAR
ncbi:MULTISPECIES: AAA family ATPase [unclassified Streptomyces]|uniref:AAA family ATPase n=1 Tax=unclassified Streptomyces TaxID=2593676 RepID=UPI000DAC8A30|nr:MULTISPECIES: AAA family ATPase [unclassified Streptomyces]PZT72110.1 chromosome segregation protein SMC [Streptomyces sp. AC1-42T]PZT81567.1 chromosome segregation protein SMC [Streptomyces sp. AC1-42W]